MTEAKTCWDFMKCPDKIKKQCPAYKIIANSNNKEGYSMYCWDIAGAKKYCAMIGQEECHECPWYKKNNKY